MTLEDLIPSKDDPRAIELCGQICPGVAPFFVPVQKWSQSVMLQCFPNVERKIRVSGGSIVYGWAIHQIPKIHIEAQFHAIWLSPEGRFVDITEEEFGMSRILFLRDDTRTYTGSKVPHFRFALGDKKLAERYWALCDESQAILLQLLEAGFRAGDPGFRQRLGGINDEIQQVKARLYAA